jgi:3-phosphoshikimate 1-carboxyvinyltransferase
LACLVIHPAQSLKGCLTIPGDKSISHRAFLLAALCHGESVLYGVLEADDVHRTQKALEALGVRVYKKDPAWYVSGVGLRGLQAPKGPLDMGNSGTTTRLLLGILAGCPFRTTLVGDASLSRRPMGRVTEPLKEMGARFDGPYGTDRLPLTVEGGALKGIRYTLPVPSAQVKSALLLAGLSAEGTTTVVEPIPTRDHTERLLHHLGARIVREGQAISLTPGQILTPKPLHIPGDFSSAAFFLVAASLVPGSHLVIQGVGLNPTRTGLLEVLKRMGARIQIHWDETAGEWEPKGDLEIFHAPLIATQIEPEEVPSLIDEIPILMVAATQAEGRTILRGLSELRVKETDRIVSMVKGLSALGARIHAQKDEVVIEGPTRLKGACVDSFKDHRTAMALAVAGLVADGTTTVQDSEWISISFPEFSSCLERLRG